MGRGWGDEIERIPSLVAKTGDAIYGELMRLYERIGRMFSRKGIENDARFLRAMKIYIAITVIFTAAMVAVIVAAIVAMRSGRHH